MRGTLTTAGRYGIRIRFIPAYAGNTQYHNHNPSCSPVHPRVCGEHVRPDVEIHEIPGSSPRMRGTRSALGKIRLSTRFIPAYAGNTGAILSPKVEIPVHPRVCGKHRPLKQAECNRTGSSPRMRGTHASHESVDRNRRFIPAYAGNTFRMRSATTDQAVHPRVCGEHIRLTRLRTCAFGSSPRMRGTLPSENWICRE